MCLFPFATQSQAGLVIPRPAPSLGSSSRKRRYCLATPTPGKEEKDLNLPKSPEVRESLFFCLLGRSRSKPWGTEKERRLKTISIFLFLILEPLGYFFVFFKLHNKHAPFPYKRENEETKILLDLLECVPWGTFGMGQRARISLVTSCVPPTDTE